MDSTAICEASESLQVLPPPSDCPNDFDLSAVADPWFVVQVKTGEESLFVNLMRDIGVAAYTPMGLKVIERFGVSREEWRPYFARYSFFAGDAEAQYAAITSHKVLKKLTIANQARFIREVDEIRRMLLNDPRAKRYTGLPIGRLHQILSPHPMVGQVGILEALDDGLFVLRVRIMADSVAWRIPKHLLHEMDDDEIVDYERRLRSEA